MGYPFQNGYDPYYDDYPPDFYIYLNDFQLYTYEYDRAPRHREPFYIATSEMIYFLYGAKKSCILT
jgi:hypothetical protein